MDNNVVELIEKSGISVRKISRETGIPYERMYAWVKRGSAPKYEDTKKVLEYFKNKMPTPEGHEPIITVLLDRVVELLAAKNGSSALAEREKIFADVRLLRDLKGKSGS